MGTAATQQGAGAPINAEMCLERLMEKIRQEIWKLRAAFEANWEGLGPYVDIVRYLIEEVEAI